MTTKRHPMTGDVPTPWAVRTGGSTGLVGSFGYTRNRGVRFHKGVDFLADVWAPVYAAHEGRIERDGFERDTQGKAVNDGYGSRVVLRSAGVETRYGHLVHQVYAAGMVVCAGELIGHVGRTGNVHTRTGSIPTHLHFEVRVYTGTKFEAVNPEWWLDNTGERLGVRREDLNV